MRTVLDCLKICNKEDLYKYFNNRFDETVDYNAFSKLLNDCLELKPVDTNQFLQIKEDNDTFLIDSSGNDFSMLFVPRKEIFGLYVEDSLIEQFGFECICSNVLYEITWFGINEKDMEAYKKETFDALDNVSSYSSFKAFDDLWESIMNEE